MKRKASSQQGTCLPCDDFEAIRERRFELADSTHAGGLYLRATLRVGGHGAVGVAIEDALAARSAPPAAPAYTAALVDVGVDGAEATASSVLRVHASASGQQAVEVADRSGAFRCGERNTTVCGVATVTAVEAGRDHALLLFARRGMWELYIDGLLVQTFVYPWTEGGVGRLGVACRGAANVAWSEVRVGHLTL